MKAHRLFIVLVALALVLALAMPVAAKKKKQHDEGNSDPMAGRIGFGFNFGGVSSSAGTGFEGGLSVTYYFNSYLSTTLGSGYGFYPVEYNGPHGDSETTQVNYIPTTLALTIYPLPHSRISPYFGPGLGMTYSWYKEKVEEDGDTVEKKFDQTLWSVFVEAGVSFALGGGFSANVGLTYTLPDVTDINFEDGYLTYSGGGGVMF